MHTSLFIRSHTGDIAWLDYCLRAIEKRTSGFAEIVVAVPSRDHDVFSAMQSKYNFRLHEDNEPAGKGFLCGMIMLCRADETCPNADYIMFIDPDWMAMDHMSPLDFFVDDKPLMVVETFEHLKKYGNQRNPPHACHDICRPTVEKALGYVSQYATMIQHYPVIHPKRLFQPFRMAVEKHTGQEFDQYVLSGQNGYPQGFAEFFSLGSYALREHAGDYFLADLENEQSMAKLTMGGKAVCDSKWCQMWSAGGLGQQQVKDIEQILNGDSTSVKARYPL